MALIEASRRRSIEALAKLHYTNPFLEERIVREREVLESDFREAPSVRTGLDYAKEPNLELLGVRIEKETARMRQGLVEGAEAGDADLELYEGLVLYLLYRRYRLELEATIRESSLRSGRVRIRYWDRFLGDARHFLALPGLTLPSGYEPAQLLADSFQVCRA